MGFNAFLVILQMLEVIIFLDNVICFPSIKSYVWIPKLANGKMTNILYKPS